MGANERADHVGRLQPLSMLREWWCHKFMSQDYETGEIINDWFIVYFTFYMKNNITLVTYSVCVISCVRLLITLVLYVTNMTHIVNWGHRGYVNASTLCGLGLTWWLKCEKKKCLNMFGFSGTLWKHICILVSSPIAHYQLPSQNMMLYPYGFFGFSKLAYVSKSHFI